MSARSWLSRILPHQKQAPRTWSLMYYPGEEHFGAPQPDISTDAPRAYATHPWVYSCIRATAQAAASVPLTVTRRGDDGRLWPADPREPLVRLLQRVNPRQSLGDILEATVMALELTGNAYWAIERDARGVPAELWPMRPDRVKILPGPHLVEGYVYEANGRRVAFKADEVIHFRYFSPADDFYGLSPMTAAADSIATDLFATSYNQGFFRRGARPEGIITSQVELAEDELKRLRAQFEELYSGVDNSHRVMILGADLDWKTLGVAPKDAEFLAQRRLSREEICAVFGVPPAVVGIYEYANYANAQLQRKLFWSETVLPKLRRIGDAINEQLAAKMDARLDVDFDASAVPALQEDAREQAEVAGTLVQRGIMTVNEVRERMYSLPPVAWGDSWWASGALHRADDLQMAQAPAPLGGAQASNQPARDGSNGATRPTLPGLETALANALGASGGAASVAESDTAGSAPAHQAPHPKHHAAAKAG